MATIFFQASFHLHFLLSYNTDAVSVVFMILQMIPTWKFDRKKIRTAGEPNEVLLFTFLWVYIPICNPAEIMFSCLLICLFVTNIAKKRMEYDRRNKL